MFDHREEAATDSPPTTAVNEAASQSRSHNPDLIDLSAVLEVMEGQTDILISVIEAFLEEAPELIQQLDQALAKEESIIASRAAHTLKGGFRILQLGELVDGWGTIENHARENQLPDIHDRIEELKQSTHASLDELRRFVDYHRED